MNNEESTTSIMIILFIIYKIGVPFMSLYFFVQSWKHIDGFWEFIGYLILSSLQGLVWPVAILF